MRLSNNRLATLAAVCVLPALVGACGGSSHRTLTVTTTQAARATPNASNPDIGAAPGQGSGTSAHSSGSSAHSSGRAKRHADNLSGPAAITSASSEASPAAAPSAQSHAGQADSGVSASTSRPQKAKLVSDNDTENMPSNAVNPCTLVTLREARSITAGAVSQAVEAPLGPTCIYRGGRRANITLAVETVHISQVTRHLATIKHVSVAGHPAYCGGHGTPVLWMPVQGNQVLNVTASCSVARQFAALALSRLTA